MKKKFIEGLVAGLLMLGVSSTTIHAATIGWSTGNYSQTGIGDQIGSVYDQFNITGLAGSIDSNDSETIVQFDSWQWNVG
jgi:hypothetical protein